MHVYAMEKISVGDIIIWIIVIVLVAFGVYVLIK